MTRMLTEAEGLQARAREAEERSRKILEEEKAKDAAWRQAVKMVSLSPPGNSAAGAATQERALLNASSVLKGKSAQHCNLI